jgi:iron(III) transport system permease protein
VVRSKFWGRWLLDQLSFMPHAIPGIVLGLAFLWVFLALGSVGLDIFGSIWSIAIAFTVSYIAYGTRAMNSAILQIHKELEQAAYVSGAPPWRTMWRIFFPLLKPTFVGVWVWVMLHVVRSASIPLILYEGPENQVLAVLIWNMHVGPGGNAGGWRNRRHDDSGHDAHHTRVPHLWLRVRKTHPAGDVMIRSTMVQVGK